jgi:hypothetical protein
MIVHLVLLGLWNQGDEDGFVTKMHLELWKSSQVIKVDVWKMGSWDLSTLGLCALVAFGSFY